MKRETMRRIEKTRTRLPAGLPSRRYKAHIPLSARLNPTSPEIPPFMAAHVGEEEHYECDNLEFRVPLVFCRCFSPASLSLSLEFLLCLLPWLVVLVAAGVFAVASSMHCVIIFLAISAQ